MARSSRIKRPLWKISVRTAPHNEEAVSEALSLFLGQTAVVFTDLKTGQTTVSVFLPKKPAWSAAPKTKLASALREACQANSTSILKGLSLVRLRNEDWAESWKRHFKPLVIGNRLLLRPSWSKMKPRRGQVVVQLDPGMSFGTGQHPTTAFCLGEITRLCRSDTSQSLLDVGTGSGILAISGAKLGYRPVHAVEIDPACVRIARNNARLNGVSREVSIRCQDVASLTEQREVGYSVVCANLMADLLLAESKRLKALCRQGGHLVLAGILSGEFAAIRKTYEALGFKLVRSRVESGWRSGCFSCAF